MLNDVIVLFQYDDLKRALREVEMEDDVDEDISYLATRKEEDDDFTYEERGKNDPPSKPHFVVMMIDDLGESFLKTQVPFN